MPTGPRRSPTGSSPLDALSAPPRPATCGHVVCETVTSDDRLLGARRSLITEVAVGVIALILLIGRNPLDLGNRWIGNVDTKYYGWLAWRLAELTSPTLRLPGVVHPAGLELGLLDGLAPITASGFLVRIFGRYVGLNLVIIGGIVANYLAARRLARVVGARGAGEVLCGLAFAAAPLLSSPASSFPPLLWAFTTPLLLAEVIPAARGDRPLRPARLAALLVGAYLCSIYHLVFGGIAVVIVAVTWPNSAVRHRDGARRSAIAVLATVLLLAPFGIARLRYTDQERSAGASSTSLLADARTFSADIGDVAILPAPLQVGPRVGLGIAERPLEMYRLATIGWALLAGIALAWGARRFSKRPTAALVPLTLAAGVLWILSLGPGLVAFGQRPAGARDWLPYRALLAIPGLSALRAPYRAAIPLAGVAVALLAVGLAQLDDRRVRRWACGAIGVLVALSWWPQIPTSTADVPDGLRPFFAEIAGADSPSDEAVMVVPFTCGFDDLDVMNWQVVHGQAMVVCGVSSSATRWQTRAAEWFTSSGLAATRCDPSIDVLGRTNAFAADLRLTDAGIADLRNSFDVRWMIFDRQRAGGCVTAESTLGALRAYTEVIDDGRFVVFDLVTPATPG